MQQHRYEGTKMSGKYEIDDDDRYESGNDYSGPTGMKTATTSSASYSNDGHKFTIINGVGMRHG